MTGGVPTLSLRTMNRTFLTRQLLDRRSAWSARQTITHLVAMQAQIPNWPYVGLWTRLADFDREELTNLYASRQVVRATMVRRTQHLAAGEDFRWLQPSVRSIIEAALTSSYYRDEIRGLDLTALADAGQELLRGRVLTRRQLGELLADRFPGRHGGRLATALELLTPVIHPPPNGVWGKWGNRTETPAALAEDWLDGPMAGPQPETMVLRYLAGFGPATVADIQAWSGVTKLRGVVDGLRDQLRVFRDPDGKELVDLPDGPISDPDTPVRVRFLPAFDNAILGHKDRRRIISDEDRRRLAPIASLGVPTFLVDGFVHGSWSVEQTHLTITPFRPLTRSATEAVMAEATALAAFALPDQSDPKVLLDRVG